MSRKTRSTINQAHLTLRKSKGYNFCWFFLNDSENASYIIAFVLNSKKSTFKKKKSFSLSIPAALPTKDITDLFKQVKNQKEENLRRQVNNNVTERYS